MFQIRAEQYAALRRKKIGDGLIGRLTPLGVDARWDDAKRSLDADDAAGGRTRIAFDSLGFVGGFTSPMGRTWQFSNLKDGKPAQLLSPSGYKVGMRYDAEGRLAVIGSTTRQPIQLRYTEKEQLAAVGFADRTWELIEYAPSGKPSAITGRLGTKTTLGYDAQERLTSITDPNGNSTRFAYSRWSRPDSTHFADGTKEFYRYDANGCVSRIVQGDVAIDLKCNDKGRPLELRYSDGTEVTHTYDDGGRIAKAAVGELVTAISYDDRGQPAEETSGADSHKFDYDELGRLIRIASGDGESVEYRWDADSRLTGFKDWNGGVHRIDYPWGDTGEAITGANGVHTLNERDAAGKLTGVSVTASGKSLYSLACSYDGEERLSGARDSIFGQHSYAYDAEGRVVASELSDKRELFRYDPAGNPTQFDGLATRVDAGNRLLSVGDEVLSYDLRGNLTGQSGPGGDWLYSYNARNQMIAVVSPTGERTAYAYDGFGRRICKRTPKTETRFVWAGESLLAEIATDRATGKVSRQDFLYKPGTFVPLATRVDGKVYSYHTDNLGTPRAVTSPDGRVVWAAELSAFGKTKLAVESVRNPLRFPGQYFDEETGFHYNRFRYYSPEWGRYITRDPIGLLGGINHYNYSSGDPLNRTDPLGLIDWASVGAIAGSVVAGAAVGALVVAAAPLLGIGALGALVGSLVLGGFAAGAVGAALNDTLHGQDICWPCVLKDGLKGAAVGLATAVVLVGGAYLLGAEALLGLGGGAAVETASVASKTVIAAPADDLDAAIQGLKNSSGAEERAYARQIAQMSTRSEKAADRVVLGKWNANRDLGYIGKARANGGTFYETDPSFYDKLFQGLDESAAREKLWMVNEEFLKGQMESGVGRFDFTLEGYWRVLDVTDSATAKEYAYLTDNASNYGYVRSGLISWIKQ